MPVRRAAALVNKTRCLEPEKTDMMEDTSSPRRVSRQSAPHFGNSTFDDLGRQLYPFAPRIEIESTEHDLAPKAIVALVVCTIIWRVTSGQRTGKSQEKPKSQRAMSGAIPPVFPNGWIPVLESSELVVGKIKSISTLGQELVAVRCEDGTARVFDAYCPHLGAHLGVMGRVVGDCIECPFHGWRFDCKDGTCTNVPYSPKAPPFVKAKAWMCKELLGLVFVWYHADGEGPSWNVPGDLLSETLESVDTGRFEHLVRCHIQDIAENGADLGHFNQMHKASSFVGGAEFERTLGKSWKGRLVQHHWAATWSPNKYEATVTIESSVSILGWSPNYLRHHIEARQVGPALVAICVWGRSGHYVAIQSLKPEAPFSIRVVHRLYFEPHVSWFLRKFYTMALRNMVDRDVAVWNYKTYLKRPALVKEDQSIAAYRKWYSQFYSASSPTWQEIREHSLDW